MFHRHVPAKTDDASGHPMPNAINMLYDSGFLAFPSFSVWCGYCCCISLAESNWVFCLIHGEENSPRWRVTVKSRCFRCGSEFRGYFCEDCRREIDVRCVRPSPWDYIRLALVFIRLALSSMGNRPRGVRLGLCKR